MHDTFDAFFFLFAIGIFIFVKKFDDSSRRYAQPSSSRESNLGWCRGRLHVKGKCRSGLKVS
jgi:hypothetical protein